MTTINTGGQAFPCPTSANFEHPASSGMTLRDWFAGMAMQGMWTDQSLDGVSFAQIADAAYVQADEMLQARGES